MTSNKQVIESPYTLESDCTVHVFPDIIKVPVPAKVRCRNCGITVSVQNAQWYTAGFTGGLSEGLATGKAIAR